MKKKLLSYFAIGTLAFLTACGGGDATNENVTEGTEIAKEDTSKKKKKKKKKKEKKSTVDYSATILQDWHRNGDDGSELFGFMKDMTFYTDVTPTGGEGFSRKGTYKLKGNKIIFKYEDMTEELTATIKIEKEVMTLTYHAGTANEVSHKFDLMVLGC